MTELEKILDVLNLDQLVSKLELAEYAFAAWRMPNTSDYRMIISLDKVDKLTDIQLADIRTGFLVNEFNDQHPVSPYYLPADIVIEGKELVVSPNVTASQIDQFRNDIEIEVHNDEIEGNILEENVNSDSFKAAVEAAVNSIKQGHFEKIVLSRYRDEELPKEFSSWEFFEEISQNYMNAFVSMTFIPGKGMWIGASPELLLSDSTDQFKTVSLAGTKQLLENQHLSEIAWTQKEIEEQAFVSRYIINCFKKIRLREFHEHGPKTISAGNLVHLKTEFIVDYNEVSFDRLSDQMLELLHPTSAVCGMPIEQTKPWISQSEDYDREFYSGFLGPVNFEGATSLFVNLRCMRIKDSTIRFYAGAGITEDSDPEKEFKETEMKMNVLKSKIRF